MYSERLKRLPPYLFVEIDRLKASYIQAGKEILDLGIGDPDMGAPPGLVESLSLKIADPAYHRYPPDRGLPKLLDAIKAWASERYGVELDGSEVLVTIGSKEAIGHLPLAVVDPGDVALVPDPGYPVYNSSAVFADAECVTVPLLESNGYWPDFGAIDPETARRAKLIYLNYPNNPTAGTASKERLRETVEFCAVHGIIPAFDAAYSEITFGRPSIPLFPLAREAGIPYIEFYSFSKTFCITGWRIGFAVGSRDVIAALARVKSNLDSGVFGAIQDTISGAMGDAYDEHVSRIRDIYRERRDILAGSLRRAGLSFCMPEATFYFWIRTPGGRGSVEFCTFLLENLGIVATPGVGFGSCGEGYFRLSVTAATDTVRKAGRMLESLPAMLGDA